MFGSESELHILCLFLAAKLRSYPSELLSIPVVCMKVSLDQSELQFLYLFLAVKLSR